MSGYPNTSGGSAGVEIGYAQITSNANITDTSEATATSLISPGALTFSGSPVYAEFYTPELLGPVAGDVAVTLFEGSTEIGRIAYINSVGSAQISGAVLARYKFTPTAGSHTYKLCAFAASTTGTPIIRAGAGGTGAWVPAYLRFVTA